MHDIAERLSASLNNDLMYESVRLLVIYYQVVQGVYEWVNQATLKQLLKRWVFKSRWKPDSESQVKMSAGRLFHVVGAVQLKARRANTADGQGR